jgi:SAM-dependent methyltransferase
MKGKELAQLYSLRFSPQQVENRRKIWQILCREYFQYWVKPSDLVVDVACGYGEFINNIEAGSKVALDLNPDTPTHLAGDVQFFHEDALAVSDIVQNADVVFTSNFLEHLPDRATLEQFLAAVYQALKPGGCYLILGPNLRYLPGAYWDFYDHTLGLTDRSLTEVLLTQGFVIEKCIDRFLPYTTKSRLPQTPWLVAAYLKLPIIWPILGKQFMVVARKP